MDKFGRNYQLIIVLPTGNIINISPPFTLEFDITRNTLTSANVAQFRIYNLSQLNRNQIRHNQQDIGNYAGIIFLAGYGNNLSKIFSGNISNAWSVREGVDFITQIESFDGGFAFNNGITDVQFVGGTPIKSILIKLGSTLPYVSLGAIGNYTGVLGRGASFSGPTIDIISQLTGGGAFIDNGKINILHDDEYLSNGVGIVVNSQSGLLGTPVLEQTIVRFDMIFEPGLNCGEKIELRSDTESNFNGDYIVTAVKHRGMISEAVCGSVITTGEFFYIKSATGVQPLT